ncbi:MAG: YaeQ family protein [Gemmatimonadales bacterium]
MALTSTIYPFDIQLADTDRGVYESVSVRLACHPSETPEALVCRALAYCLEYTEGIGFSAGLSDGTEPAIWVKDLTGALRCWIDIGSPDAARLHRASKLAPRVAVYTHKDPATLVRQLEGERIHRREAIELYAMDRPLLDGMVARLERRMRFDLTVADRHLFLTIGAETLTGEVRRVALGP